MQNQKKKTEEERTLCAQLERENKMLSETCEGLQKKHSKLQQDLQIKEGAILNLDSKLSHYKQKEENEKVREQACLQIYRSIFKKIWIIWQTHIHILTAVVDVQEVMLIKVEFQIFMKLFSPSF